MYSFFLPMVKRLHNYRNQTILRINSYDNTIEFEKRKIQMIEENPIRKYTFLKNTIQEYRIINGNLVPVNKEQK
jgi:hypothetical protein